MLFRAEAEMSDLMTPPIQNPKSEIHNRKKLIEVALPLEKINVASAREKSIRHGHPSTLHLWWARRPLAAARAVIFAQMVDDPSEYVAELRRDPVAYVQAQRTLMEQMAAWTIRRRSFEATPVAGERAVLDPGEAPTLEECLADNERQRLFRLIEQLVLWENTTNEDILQQARDEIGKSWRRTCADNHDHPRAAELFNPEKLPAFHDPFAGGGALPLEAQRLGLESYASDLNPVAVLINKAMIEIPPKFAGRPPVNPDFRLQMFDSGLEGKQSKIQNPKSAIEWRGAAGLAADVRYYGQWMRDEAEKRIGYLYPKVQAVRNADGSYRHATEAEIQNPQSQIQNLTVIAWLWARTVNSPNPAFAHVAVPLASTFMLSTKPGKEAYVEPVITGDSYRFTVKVGKPKDAEAAKNGTKLSRGANFRCLMSETPIAGDYIKAEGVAGRMGARMMAIVAEGERGRIYLAPTPEHEAIAKQAKPTWQPDVAMPENPRWFSPPFYGLLTFGDLFTPRQLVALNTFSELVQEARERVREDSLGARASRPRTTWHRTHLPHFEAGNVAQHITFRLADSLPSAVLVGWESELAQLTETKRDVERRKRIETYLDQGHGSCALRDPRIATIVADALSYFDGTRYQLHEWVIMPNHVHVLMTPLYENSLSSILHSWKSFTAKQANRILGRTGAFWQEDYFDRVIRNERHWDAAVAYVRENPVKVGLCATPEGWRFGSAGIWEGGRPALDEAGLRAGRPRSQEALSLAEGGTGATAYADAVAVYLGIALSRLTDICNALCRWEVTKTQVRNLFGRQAIPMLWDFAENNVFGEAAGDYMVSLSSMVKALEQVPTYYSGIALQNDAQSQSVSLDKLVSTDPPYYDNIGYADLSDFFYIWLRRTLRPVFPDLFVTLAVPKAEELIATPYRHGGKEQAETFFLEGMTRAMQRLAEQAHPAFPVTIYYAYKQSETSGSEGVSPSSGGRDALAPRSTGWETFLDAVIRAGFAISGTWPMRTELSNRMIGSGTNALASSIVLVCRPRPANAPTVTRRDFLAALKDELPVALSNMQRGNIAPVDLAQASIGPGMGVFTRYGKVIDATGKALTVREALTLINQSLDEVLAEQEGDFDSDTRWALAWFDQYGFAEGEYGVAETLSKAKNTSVAGMVTAGILTSGAGKVRLLRPEELPANWNPDDDERLTVWEMVHHLVRVLNQGEQAAATLLAKLGARADIARELAYRLYALCERKKRAAEALAYNGLVQSWPEMLTLAQAQRRDVPVQLGF
ncbi:MAG: DUF1156 domain-containing protein [Chloroflexales bacterium]